MTITIYRHGKVNMEWKKFYTSKQYDFDCEQYDKLPIIPIKNKITAPNVIVYISTMSRSRETAQQLFGRKELKVTELINEVSMKSSFDSVIPLPLWFWDVVGRLEWFINLKRQPESRNQTILRADKMVKAIIEGNKDCIIISHGFFMHIFIKELKKVGFVIDNRKLSFENLDKIVAYRK